MHHWMKPTLRHFFHFRRLPQPLLPLWPRFLLFLRYVITCCGTILFIIISRFILCTFSSKQHLTHYNSYRYRLPQLLVQLPRSGPDSVAISQSLNFWIRDRWIVLRYGTCLHTVFYCFGFVRSSGRYWWFLVYICHLSHCILSCCVFLEYMRRLALSVLLLHQCIWHSGLTALIRSTLHFLSCVYCHLVSSWEKLTR